MQINRGHRWIGQVPRFTPAARTLLEHLPAGWECDLATETLRWSPGVYDLFGIARGAHIDRREIVQQYDEESRAILERLRSEAIATNGSFTFEARVQRIDDGAWRWIRLTADIARRNGRAAFLYGTKQDITAEISRPHAVAR